MRLNYIETGDAAALMKKNIPDDSIDMILTSPPYEELRDYEGFDFNFPLIAYECYRVIKPGGVIVWIVSDQTGETGESGESFRQCLFFKGIGARLHDTMFYMKSGPAYPSQDKYYQVIEYMFIFSKGKPKTFNPIKDRENRWHGEKWSKIRSRRQKNGDLKKQTWSVDEGEKFGVRYNIWQYQVGYGYQGDKYSHMHPASFPEALADDHIRSWSNPGDVILDPLCGSGTSLKMAKQNHRSWIGFDLSEKYCEISAARVRETQPRLFLESEGK